MKGGNMSVARFFAPLHALALAFVFAGGLVSQSPIADGFDYPVGKPNGLAGPSLKILGTPNSKVFLT